MEGRSSLGGAGMNLWNRQMLRWSEQIPCTKKMWVQGITSANWIQVLLPFPSFLLEKLLWDNSVKLLSMPRPGLI